MRTDTTLCATDPEEPASWPPHDPTEYTYSDPDHTLTLPSSPWTYDNGSLNPSLRPSNGTTRQRRPRRTQAGPTDGIASVPPYHPDYDASQARAERADAWSIDGSTAESASESEDEYDEREGPPPRVRRDSEGYVVAPIGREDMLARYIEGLTSEEGRYQRYEPELVSESSDEEDVPLAEAPRRAVTD